MTEQEELLEFWFGEIEETTEYLTERRRLWFIKSQETDRLIEERFRSLWERTRTASFKGGEEGARPLLARIIILDQLSRNLHRGAPDAFAQDEIALQLCMTGIQAGIDKELHPLERLFFYLPLEHSENLFRQEYSVQLFRELSKETTGDLHAYMLNTLDYAQRHRDIILRFGRFPHRNEALSRTSTEEEIAFLKEPGSSF